MVAVSVGHPAAGVTSGAVDPRQRSAYLRWFLPPGVAERMLPRDGWRLFRDWGWHGAEPNTDPDCDRQIADLSRAGALTAGLNWYRSNLGSAAATDQPVRAAVPMSCPTMGVWSSGEQFLPETQMTRYSNFRHWAVAVRAADLRSLGTGARCRGTGPLAAGLPRLTGPGCGSPENRAGSDRVATRFADVIRSVDQSARL